MAIERVLQDGFDWKHPDYPAVFQKRMDRLAYIRSNPSQLPSMRGYYTTNPAQFITDWGCTTDPRNVELNRPVILPFILFPLQVKWVDWVMESWKLQRPGVTPKSRESGLSWLAIALSCTLCIFHENMVIGFGSSLARLVDDLGNPDCLFWKAREFMVTLPKEFRGNWTRDDAPQMRIKFPNGSVIKGEGGDNIGRGGRSSLYFLDEAAFLPRPEISEASLSQTTNCRQDISTANGLGNPFHTKVMTWPPERKFIFHWRDDPRKDEVWYEKQKAEKSPVVIASELDIDFAASIEGILIPNAWVQAAVDAHVKLGITPTGAKSGALDVADEGRDLNAFCGAHGILIEHMEEWSGKGDDIFGTVQRAFGICDVHAYREFRYDADGLGAGVRGDARIINTARVASGSTLAVNPFRGSGPVHNPEGEDVKGRKNQDFFANAKAQSWWGLRTRFQKTHRWIVDGEACAPDDIISISSKLPHLQKLLMELSQPTMTFNGVGKMIIDKMPDGQKSPNLADAVMIRFCVGFRPMQISQQALRNLGIR